MPERKHPDSFGAQRELLVSGRSYTYHSLSALEERGLVKLNKLPFSIKIMLEAVLRSEDNSEITHENIERFAAYDPARPGSIEVPHKPCRVLLQDFTGVPAIVDLAAMRSAMVDMGGDPARINPQIPVDLVIDHSVQVDEYGTSSALSRNAGLELERNKERYEFLRWGQSAFDNFSVVPPASGICHQVNLEHLGSVIKTELQDGKTVAFPDTLVGTDSHTPMIAGLGILGWGVGGIEAEAVMLGRPLHMLAPPVVGVKLTGALPPGTTATDLVLLVTQTLRKRGVVGKFVEFYGKGLSKLTVTDRATIANMAPEYGATVGFFPVDEQTLLYLRNTGRADELIELVEAYCKAQALFRTDDTVDPVFENTVEIDLGTVKTSLAGPKRPQDRVELGHMKETWQSTLAMPQEQQGFGKPGKARDVCVPLKLDDKGAFEIGHGAVVLAAITSCTNTSNPAVMLAAGLVAKKAAERGLRTKPWVKTSLAPGSMVVTDYLKSTNLLPHLETLGFHVVGYGCTTCIGNSGPLPRPLAEAIEKNDLVVAGVLSGNRNFEGRIHPHVRANYLGSPPLVVAYALAGRVDIDFANEPLGRDENGENVFLKDLWPTNAEITVLLEQAYKPELFRSKYDNIATSNEVWNAIPINESKSCKWSQTSTYIQRPPFFEDMSLELTPTRPIRGARTLLYLGDSVTTDHISPAGAIALASPAGRYLQEHGVEPKDFNSYGSRRGNDQVMTRGTFANIRLKNKLAPGTEGGFTTDFPTGEVTTVYEAAKRYRERDIPTIVVAGKDYGMGSSRDWAAKGTRLLGIQAVIAESYERIHRSNLVGMGVLPLQFLPKDTFARLGLKGSETFDIHIDEALSPGQKIPITARVSNGESVTFEVLCRLDTAVELDYYRNGGILHAVLRNFLASHNH